MESIVVAIVTGLFTLSGIWYQNYLSRKSSKASRVTGAANEYTLPNYNNEATQSARNARTRRRMIFTLLVVALPWLTIPLIQILVHKLDQTPDTEQFRQHFIDVFAAELIGGFSAWSVITIIALGSGWKNKTVFERVILIVSAITLIYMSYTRYLIFYNH